MKKYFSISISRHVLEMRFLGLHDLKLHQHASLWFFQLSSSYVCRHTSVHLFIKPIVWFLNGFNERMREKEEKVIIYFTAVKVVNLIVYVFICLLSNVKLLPFQPQLRDEMCIIKSAWGWKSLFVCVLIALQRVIKLEVCISLDCGTILIILSKYIVKRF